MTSKLSSSFDFFYSTARGLREKFDSREFTAVEATRASLERISALEPKINSFITITPDEALSAAEAADQRLQGVGQALLR